MLGAIIGDIAGSTYERCNFKFECCPIFAPGSQFTDDTVLTLATADHFIFGDPYSEVYRRYGQNYPHAGYGASFRNWMISDNPQPYNSWGNGAAMRASPIGWVAADLEWALDEAKRSAEVTHDHPNGIKGAQAVVAAVFLARSGASKDSIRSYIAEQFRYNLDRTVAQIRPGYLFEVNSEWSVPETIIAFLESTDFESAIRKAISLGGDSDTIACIAGANRARLLWHHSAVDDRPLHGSSGCGAEIHSQGFLGALPDWADERNMKDGGHQDHRRYDLMGYGSWKPRGSEAGDSFGGEDSPQSRDSIPDETSFMQSG